MMTEIIKWFTSNIWSRIKPPVSSFVLKFPLSVGTIPRFFY